MQPRAFRACLTLMALAACDDDGARDRGEGGSSSSASGWTSSGSPPGSSGTSTVAGGGGDTPASGASGSGGPGGGGSGTTTGTGAGDAGGGQPISSCTDTACAFPGAEGFGTATPGGRGGQVIVVDTLAPDGPGSLTEALLTAGPRVIVFAVSGVIDFAGASIELTEAQSFVTVAGQSSPGGITLRNVTLSSYHSGFHDAVFRFLRVRGTSNADNLSFATVSNIVIDHMDFSGATDETFDMTASRDFTISWSTISNSTGGPGSQGYGALIAYMPTTNISIHHNLMANHAGRCAAQMHWAGEGEPPEGGATLDFRNNVLHNCGSQQLLRAEGIPTTGIRFNLVGNFARSGPATPAESMMFGVWGDIHLADNVYEGQSMILTPYFEGTQHDAPFEFPAVTTSSATVARGDVLRWVGAWPRDAMNVRTIDEVEAGAGQLGAIDDALIVDGPPAAADGDADGLPDSWEVERGLDPQDGADSAAIAPGGYAHIEIYLAERAALITGH